MNTLLQGVVLGRAVVISKLELPTFTPSKSTLVMYFQLFFYVLLGNLREIMDEQLALELSRNVSVS